MCYLMAWIHSRKLKPSRNLECNAPQSDNKDEKGHDIVSHIAVVPILIKVADVFGGCCDVSRGGDDDCVVLVELSHVKTLQCISNHAVKFK